jgi:hypothetical protein
MLFRLTTAPPSFHDMMNDILKDFLDKGVMVNVDNILILAKYEEMYNKLLKVVLEMLAKNDLVMIP